MIAAFDTNILIDALNAIPQVAKGYERYERVIISRITWMEVMAGAGGDESVLRAFMDDYFDILPVDIPVAEAAVRLRRERRPRLPDAIIWATAQVHDAVLVTRNSKDFSPAWPGIHEPYRL